MRDGFGKTEANGGWGDEGWLRQNRSARWLGDEGWLWQNRSERWLMNEEAICGLGLAKMGKKGLERGCHKSFGRKTALVSTKKRTFARNFQNVDRFGLLATTVKNAKTTWINLEN